MDELVKRIMQSFTVLLFIVIIIILVNILVIALNGETVPAPTIERAARRIGQGNELQYVILGDSTTVAQGAAYEDGYVVKTAEKLAENYQVTYTNYGVSGATIGDVLREQLPQIPDGTKPDLVLVAAGANDVTHLTRLSSIRNDLRSIITRLREKNPDVRIILTGAASMGDVKRFPQPTKWLAGLRTKQINTVFIEIVKEKDVIFADVAAKTSESFSNNPQYFAPDNFHPNREGYQEWTNVISEAITAALQSK